MAIYLLVKNVCFKVQIATLFKLLFKIKMVKKVKKLVDDEDFYLLHWSGTYKSRGGSHLHH